MKSFVSLFQNHDTMRIFKVVLLHIFIVFIGKWIYNRYVIDVIDAIDSCESYESFVDKKEMSMLNEIHSLLEIQKNNK